MGVKFDALYETLKLGLLNDTERLNALKDWCEKNVSRDIDDMSEATYTRYEALAQDFLDRFIPATQAHLTEVKAELENLTPIQYAAYRGFDRFIESLDAISENAFNTGNASEMTPLHLAAQLGHVHTTEALLAKGADCSKKNILGELPLHVALALPLGHTNSFKANKETIFRTLWQNNPDTLTDTDLTGNTALHVMACHGYNQLLQDVLESYPEGASKFNHYGQSPIHTAILNHQIDAAKHLLSIPGVSTLADAEYRVPLHYAARYGNKEMMELCCGVTDDLNKPDTEGKTALMLAIEAENHEAQQVLAAHGISHYHLK